MAMNVERNLSKAEMKNEICESYGGAEKISLNINGGWRRQSQYLWREMLLVM
jgi:hypothetical protein